MMLHEGVFYALFRTTPATVELLCQTIAPWVLLPLRFSLGFLDTMAFSTVDFATVDAQVVRTLSGARVGRKRSLPVIDCVLATLKRLRTCTGISAMAADLCCSPGSAVLVYRHVCWSIVNGLMGTYLQFPTQHQQQVSWARIPAAFRAHFEGKVVAGCVDGTFFPLPRPCREYPPYYGQYFSGKYGIKDYNYNHQFVFDLSGKILFASFGERGQIPDIVHFRDTVLFTATSTLLPANHMLLADKGYYGAEHVLLVPFKEPGMNDAKRNFNAVLGYLRSVAENGIGAFKSLFPLLKCKLQRVHWQQPPRVALACACLYNFFHEHGNRYVADFRLDYLLDESIAFESPAVSPSNSTMYEDSDEPDS